MSEKVDVQGRASTRKSALFQPIRLRGTTLANRLVYSPMGQYMADEHGSATDRHVVHLGTMSLSGASLVYTEAAAVEKGGRDVPTSLGLYTDKHEEVLARVLSLSSMMMSPRQK